MSALRTALIPSQERAGKDKAGKNVSDDLIQPHHFTDGETEVRQEATTC